MINRKNKKRDGGRKLDLVTNENMPFAYVEAYKSLRTNLKFIMATENINSIAITSALQNEGKSNVSVNLAVTMAEEGKHVLIVDGDLRKSTLQKFFKLRGIKHGITSYLAGECGLDEAIVHIDASNVDVLPVGTVPPNPTELLAMPRMKKLLDRLKQIYDCVIVDTPPINVVTDAAIIGNMVDGTVLVVRANYCPAEIVAAAKKKLEDVNIRLLGAILTRLDLRETYGRGSYYYSYYYKYYSYKNYGYKYE